MDNSSYFIKNKCLFGPYPSKQDIIEFLNHGINIFVNLTTPEEKLEDYQNLIKAISCNSIEYINFPIPDHKYPKNIYEFYRMLYYLKLKILSGNKIYIHCKGGHGRSGMVSCMLICMVYNIQPKFAIEYITECHKNRKNLRKIWLNVKCPNSKLQRFFIYKSFTKVYINKYDTENELNIKSFCPIIINNSLYNTVEEAFNYLCIDKGIKLQKDKYILLKEIILKKLIQHKNLFYNIFKTGIRPIVYDEKYYESENIFEGKDKDKDSKYNMYNMYKNSIGYILHNIRDYYYTNYD